MSIMPSPGGYVSILGALAKYRAGDSDKLLPELTTTDMSNEDTSKRGNASLWRYVTTKEQMSII